MYCYSSFNLVLRLDFVTKFNFECLLTGIIKMVLNKLNTRDESILQRGQTSTTNCMPEVVGQSIKTHIAHKVFTTLFKNQ